MVDKVVIHLVVLLVVGFLLHVLHSKFKPIGKNKGYGDGGAMYEQ